MPYYELLATFNIVLVVDLCLMVIYGTAEGCGETCIQMLAVILFLAFNVMVYLSSHDRYEGYSD